MKKPKTPQPKTPEEVQIRDSFQTPKYATKLLLPFLSKTLPVTPSSSPSVWECAAGSERMTGVFRWAGYSVVSTDLSYAEDWGRCNFLTDTPLSHIKLIATNPPFSLKENFYSRCRELGVPFALLIPADNSQWIWDAVHVHGCEKILPRRRVDYITPNILDIVCRGESFMELPVSIRKNSYGNKPKNMPRQRWNMDFMYPTIDECPKELLAKWSTSQFHSMWLTWGLGLGQKEVGVDLTNEMKLDI